MSAVSSREIPVSETSAAHAKAVELGKHVLRMTTAAGSGHPSSALGIVHIVVELMYRAMRYDLNDPWNPGNDRLVLSIGHAVPMVYAAYADLGGVVGRSKADSRRLTVEDLDGLRELSSVLDGHPNPAEEFPFFDAATGSLGQGLSVAAGLALAARLDGIDKRIYVILGDGESREGQVWEAADFIIDHELHNVCAIFSCNGHGQADAVSVQQSAATIAAKMRAYGWYVLQVDGHDPAALSAAFQDATRQRNATAVVARTVKGWGVPAMIGQNYHGKPLAEADLPKALAELSSTGQGLGATLREIKQPPRREAVRSRQAAARIELPPIDAALRRVGLASALEKKKLATRVAYGAALVALGDADPRVVALDGDVSNSTYANLFAKEHPQRFFESKIAEQNMISAAVGLAAGGKVPFASSFAKFIMRGADQIDMACISRANLKLVGSHSGVSPSADGPSQMGLSDLAFFRCMTKVDNGRGTPACYVFHPSDPISAYRCTELMANIDGLCYLRTHRPDANFLYPLDECFELRGCKQLRAGGELTLVSSGYMVHPVLEAARRLEAKGIGSNVFDVYTYPFDPAPIFARARAGTGIILTVEDNYAGGLHAELAEAAATNGDVRVEGMTPSRIPKSGKTADEVFTYVGIGVEQIMERGVRLTRRQT